MQARQKRFPEAGWWRKTGIGRWTMVLVGWFGCAAVVVGEASQPAERTEPVVPYTQVVAIDQPVAWWRFDEERPAEDVAVADTVLATTAFQGVRRGVEGPRPPWFPAFSPHNRAVEFNGKTSVLKIPDPGEGSLLDFTLGEALTLEAWVDVTKLADGQHMYVVGKGRTKNPGFPAENQNYALRLTGRNGQACVSFLFRESANRPGRQDDYHRWTAREGFPVDSGWHHIAVTYRFGEPDSLAAYVDGRMVPGAWDLGGPTPQPPVVDNDELWIGSSQGVSPGSTFQGFIDEVAIYRTALPAERVAARFVKRQPPSYHTPAEALPEQGVLVEIMQGIPDRFSWDFPVPEPSEQWTQPYFALVDLPQHYTAHGVRGDRSNPLLVRMSGWVTWPAGPVQVSLRSRSGSRLWIEGQLIAENAFPPNRGDGHNELYPEPDRDPQARRPVQPGDFEVTAEYLSPGTRVRVQVDVFVGGKKHRPELGELVLTAWPQSEPEREPSVGQAAAVREQVVGSGAPLVFTTAEWLAFVERERARLQAVNQERRLAAAKEWTAYWDRRHAWAREVLKRIPAPPVPANPEGYPAHNEIDHFVNARLAAQGVPPLPELDDASFLRRLSLDIRGVIPAPELVQAFREDRRPDRRSRWIERLLADPSWADHWVGYWQDVLAENPNLVNPTLNNTGPFRWWLHESFLDNKPFDRLATELMLLEGSTHYGGPAGFGLATQNDAPQAAKAHILAQAFLGMELKCARCHDAPYHPFTQKDLFSLASMLHREPVKVPATSSIPGDPAALSSLLVKVSLKPGEPVPGEWPFADALAGRVPDELLSNPQDSREQLAARITAPENRRFAQVIVNRLWQRYFGRGVVEPVDDWEHAQPSHPELLEYLERLLIQSGYDLKQVARVLFQSHLYQRQADPLAVVDARRAALFAGPTPRRLAAEQIVDSLLVASGKPLRVEELNIDVDSMRSYEQSLNLGPATRAWHFTSLSNERDRPSLALPAAQTVIDLLETFGWRGARPDPLTVRPQETTILQPAIFANGVFVKRMTQLSEDSRFTALALSAETVEEFVEAVFWTIFTRPPTREEHTLFTELLTPGFADRVVARQPAVVRPLRQTGVSWSNHLKPEASERKLALQREVEAGDPPSVRLKPDWRERAEDMLWALFNSPEFVFVP